MTQGNRKTAKLELSELHKSCLRMIARRDSGNPVSYKDIAVALNVNDRKIRQAVEDLVMIFRLPIGSSYSSRRPGYFWLKTREEARKASGTLIRHGVKIIRRGQILGKLSEEEVQGQLRIEFPVSGQER